MCCNEIKPLMPTGCGVATGLILVYFISFTQLFIYVCDNRSFLFPVGLHNTPVFGRSVEDLVRNEMVNTDIKRR
eukprot:gene11988-8260_t